jgi:hypothetical protein
MPDGFSRLPPGENAPRERHHIEPSKRDGEKPNAGIGIQWPTERRQHDRPAILNQNIAADTEAAPNIRVP